MHIGIDARLPAFRTGGISEYVCHLIDALASVGAGERFTIFHARHDPTLRFPSGASNMTRANLATPCHHPFERILLAAELRPFGLDVFHSPDFIPPMSGARRRVATVHDLAFLSNPEHQTPDALRHYAGQIAWALESADAVAADSEHTRTDILGRWPVRAEKIVTIPLAAASRFCIEHDATAVAGTLDAYGLGPGYILFVGTIEPRKNLITLLRAAEILHDSRPADTPLVIVGEQGWLCDEVVAEIARSRAHVRRLGWIPADRLSHLYAAAGVLAVPSITEGFGLPMPEAMQSGCPVVASAGGALPETAGGAALLVDPLDTHGWAAALTRVLDDLEIRQHLRTQGLMRARHFSWARTASATLALYRGA